MIIEELAANIVNTNFEVFEADTLEKAKRRLIDVVGCTIGGANGPGCTQLLDLIREWGGNPAATILVHGGKTTAGNAAMINSIMARSYDFGVLTPFIGEKAVWSHIAETTVPTAFTMAEWKQAGGKELLTALILGDDLSTRISAASSYTPDVSWDSPGTVNKFGAVAIAGKLMNLSERQIINAMGIVLNQLAGSFQPINDGAVSFKLAQGLAFRDGIIAAELAQKGWNGGKDPLLGKYGYFSLYCQECDPGFLTNNLGKEFYGDLIYKPYPSCRFIHSSIDCALQIAREKDFKADKIENATLDIAPMHFDGPLNQPFEYGEFPQCHANFSLRYNVANVLVRGSNKLEHFMDAMICDPEVGELARRLEVTDRIVPQQIEAARLVVRMKDGRKYTAAVEEAKGHPLKKPLSKNEIEDKFRANIAFSQTISDADSERALKLLNYIEEVDDISELVGLLTG